MNPRLGRQWTGILLAGMALHFAGASAADDPQSSSSGAPRVIAFGDVHGGYEDLCGLLRTAKVIDGADRWIGGDTQVVAMGDLIDRGPASRAVLDLVMRLQDEARAADGRFHVVLGNHEVMNLLADYRYVSDEDFAGFSDLEPPGRREQALEAFSAAQTGSSADEIRTEFLERYPPGYFGRRAAFAPAGIYGSWLLSLPVLVAVGDTAFVHGGLPPVVSELGGDVLNETLRRDLRGFIAKWQTLTSAGVIEWDTDPLDAAGELAARLGEGSAKELPDNGHRAAAQAFVAHSRSAAFDETGPLWYRGTAYCHPLLEEAVLGEALAALGVKRVVIGHSPTANRRIVSRLAGGAVLVDTGMYDAYFHGRAAALVIEPEGVSALYPDEPGRTALSIEQPNALSPYRDIAEIERMLSEASVSAGAESGDRHYTLVEVTDSASRLDARFTSARGYEKEIAAWRLDRELGLGMAPPAVRRTVEGKDGALMLWAGKLRSEADRAEGEFERPNWCASGNDYQLMYVFDALLHNPRTTESIRYTWAQKSLVLTDHLQAFGTQSEIPEYLRGADVVVPRELGARLAALDRERLEGLLGDLLSGRQIRAVLERRDRILERWPPPAPEQSGGAGSSPAAAR